jgi:5-methyltetrahydrofolate--homocysteine methyltransferase
MPVIRDLLALRGVLLLDGAWGTTLQSFGLAPGACTELWNAQHPEQVAQVAGAYADAGADLVSTNSFGGNRYRLAQHGMTDRVTELNSAAVRLSLEGVGGRVPVVASVGPTGVELGKGVATSRQVREAFAEQVAALAEAGAAAVLVETMYDPAEVRAAVSAAKSESGLEVACCLTLQRRADGHFQSLAGAGVEELVHAALAEGADFIGANCTLDPQEMVDLIAALHHAAPGVPIIAKPNAGQPVPWEGGLCYPETPESMAAWLPALVEAGATLIGGCCGTGPKHIRALRHALDTLPQGVR